MLELFGDDRSRYRDFVETRQTSDDFDLSVHSVAYDRPVAEDGSFSYPAIDCVLVAVSEALENRGPNEPVVYCRSIRARQLALFIAVNDLRLARDECAARLGITPNAVSSCVSRVRSRLGRDAALATMLERCRRVVASI